MKKVLVTCGLIGLMLVSHTRNTPNYFGTMTSYAAEVTQSTRWEGVGDIWRLKTADGGGYVTNSWFQDNDGSWYMIGSDGQMLSGLITDQSTGKSYYCNINHDGYYGRMQVVDGVYNINGKDVYMTFNQSHDGSYGAITTGLTEARSTGVTEKGLASIPTDTATAESQNQNTSNNNGESLVDEWNKGMNWDSADWNSAPSGDFGKWK